MDKEKKLVSIRLKQEEAIEYKKVLLDLDRNITDDLTEHIDKQTKDYALIDSHPIQPVNQKEKGYAQIGFLIDVEAYKKYKRVLLDHSTHTTADIKRHILKIIEENRL